MNKKAMQLGELLTVAMIFVVATIGISIGADVLDSIGDDQTDDSYAKNVTTFGLESLGELGGWLPTLALVVAASIVIGILIYAFAK